MSPALVQWLLLLAALLTVVLFWIGEKRAKKIVELERDLQGAARACNRWRDENHRVRQALLKLAFPSAITTSHETREELKKLLEEML